MGKSPAFQLYAADFYVDTAGWTPTQVGVYLRLLLHEWINGPLPNKISILARIAGIDVRNMQRLWSAVLAEKFTTDAAGMYVNPRLEKEREKQLKYRELQAISGKIGAEKRWKTHSKPYSDPNGESIALQSSISSNSIPYQKIVSYLNLKTGKNFKYKSKETQRHIRARWKNGFTFDNFCIVIDKKCEKWLFDAKMVDYLRPETLFGTKFESYLNEGSVKQVKMESVE